MTVKFLQGDIFATEADAYAHGCNCVGAMGAGVAVEFKKRWPDMYRTYRRLCKDGDFKMGGIYVYGQDPVIFNLGTQPSTRQGATLTAIRESVGKMIAMVEAHLPGVATIAIPAIGAGLGGLDWQDVKQVLIEVAQDSHVVLLVAEKFTPNQPLQ